MSNIDSLMAEVFEDEEVEVTSEKRKPAGYVNWSLMSQKRSNKALLTSDRGLVIWPYEEDDEYRSEAERKLVELAKANGGYLEVTLKARIVIPGAERKEVSTEDLLAELNAA